MWKYLHMHNNLLVKRERVDKLFQKVDTDCVSVLQITIRTSVDVSNLADIILDWFPFLSFPLEN